MLYVNVTQHTRVREALAKYTPLHCDVTYTGVYHMIIFHL
ncbi:hypothetical protein APHMUC_1193 [Anaplasma phagocytophilum str. ApMUC09]|uniref:Uncharacterized protein n=1 Tax=Anaplasma phagocytophilum str. ApMUC09 TaxID=1359152 RepID=A0A0F3ND09_ANAPH|nr:hypothetical protein APHMUC_1193 [Anaplasma phagocytophilum str. ApMUC09]